MTAVMDLRSSDMPALFMASLRGVWQELPKVLLAGGVWALTLAPAALSATSGGPLGLTALALLPSCLASTGMAQVAHGLRQGEPVWIRRMAHMDPVLGLLVAGGVSTVMALSAVGGLIQAVGLMLGAVLCLCLPMACAYGAARQRQGVAALRGGLILAVHRPGVALSLVAIAVLLGFGVLATAGALILIAPVLFATLSTTVVVLQLAAIDGAGSSPKVD